MKKNFISSEILIALTLIILINIGCSKTDDSKESVAKVPVENFSKLDVCGCNKQANIILDESTTLRKKFVDMKTFKKDVKSVKQIRSWAKNWTSLMKACFTKNGSNMWIPSDCNNMKIIEKKKEILYNLGILIDQGEKVRL